MDIWMVYRSPSSPCPTKPRAWPKLHFTLYLRCPVPLCKTTQHKCLILMVPNGWDRDDTTSHPSRRLMWFFPNGNWIEETTHLKTATSVQRLLPVLANQCAGEPGKMLRDAPSRAKDGQFVAMYKKVQRCSLKKEESIKDSEHRCTQKGCKWNIQHIHPVQASLQMDPQKPPLSRVTTQLHWDISSRGQSVRPLPAWGNYPAPHFCICCHRPGA